MLDKATIVANVAVNDLQTAKDFYGGKLGLKQLDENIAGVTYEAGGARLFVYQSSTAGKGEATCCTFEVRPDSVAEHVKALKDQGIAFEQYDFPGAEHDGDMIVMGGHKAAWFKDPDGNILCVAGKM